MSDLTTEEEYLLNNARYFFSFWLEEREYKQFIIQSGKINGLNRYRVAASLVNKGYLKKHLNLKEGFYYTLVEP